MNIQNIITEVLTISLITVAFFLVMGGLIGEIKNTYDKNNIDKDNKKKDKNNGNDYDDGHYDGYFG